MTASLGALLVGCLTERGQTQTPPIPSAYSAPGVLPARVTLPARAALLDQLVPPQETDQTSPFASAHTSELMIKVVAGQVNTFIDHGQYAEAITVLKPLAARWGRASREGAVASYLLAAILYDDGQYVRALAEATTLQHELGQQSVAPKSSFEASKRSDVAISQKLATLISYLEPKVAEEMRLMTLTTLQQPSAGKLTAQGNLEAFRGHKDAAAVYYKQALAALKNTPAVLPAARLQIERSYLSVLIGRPSSGAELAALAMRLLTAEGLSPDERRLGLKAAAPFLARTPVPGVDAELVDVDIADVDIADEDLATASREAAEDLLGRRPAVGSGFLGRFVMALCRDTRSGFWVGTEDQGVWHFDSRLDPKARLGHWTQFTVGNTEGALGDDAIYALCCDQKGRLWAGTLRHGVSVFNGQTWRTYGLSEGLAGCRVFAAACCPATGDVWIATEGGLSRYISSKDCWATYSQRDGLPSNAVTSLAFGKDGTIYVGTPSDGIAVAPPAEGYGHWHTVMGPAGPVRSTAGVGLPSSSITCLLVARNGTIYAGTDEGLARSGDGGRHWRYLRGANAPAQIKNTIAERADAAMVSGIEIFPTSGLSMPSEEDNPRVAVAAGRSRADGGGLTDYFSADDDPSAGRFDGGASQASDEPVDVDDPLLAAPQTMYRTARFGNFTYVSPFLTPGEAYWIRLDFAETVHDGPGQRIFDVFANGATVLTKLDVFAAAGRNKALSRQFKVQADKQGHIMLRFHGADTVPDNPHALTENYVTCLAEDNRGHLWVGHRQLGVEVLNPATGDSLYSGLIYAPLGDKTMLVDQVASLLPSDGGALVGGYGFGTGGLQEIKFWPGLKPVEVPSLVQKSKELLPPLPAPAAVPTLTALNRLLQIVSVVPPDPQEMTPHVTVLSDDWSTEGDWLGRYGRYWASLFALCSPSDYIWGAGWEPVHYASKQGPSPEMGDSLRYWVQWLYTADSRVLEMPPTYLDSRIKLKLTDGSQPRRESEQDDHGESFGIDYDGLSVYEILTVPTGLYVLSLYEVNKDGRDTKSRVRDYRLSVRPHPAGQSLDDLTGFQEAPEWAHGHVNQFWYGVWKRFEVRGPVTLTVKIGRNHSICTILSAATLDLVDETPPPYFGTVEHWKADQARQAQERSLVATAWHTAGGPGLFRPAATAPEAAERLMAALARARLVNSIWWGVNARRFYGPLLCWYAAQPAYTGQPAGKVLAGWVGSSSEDLRARLTTCYYEMGMYPQWEEYQRKAGLTPARDVEKALRWDGISDAGQGFQVVTQYLSEQAAKQGSKKQASQKQSGEKMTEASKL